MSDRKKVDGWGSRLGVILAVAGSAVGLGNFLRFPGQVANNGGGTFMIPYFIAFILLGIPICWVEWSMGREGGRFGFHSCPAIFGAVGKSRVWRYLGVVGIIVPLVIYMYYIVIESWCLGYALSYAFGMIDLGDNPAEYTARSSAFFDSFVGMKQDGFLSQGLVPNRLLLWGGVFTINFILIYNGISRGVETFCKWAMPMMGLCAFAVLIRVLTLDVATPEFPERTLLNGLGFMWNPKPAADGGPWWTTLGNSEVWLAATGQIFFSLSVGLGVIINYASYLKRDDDVVLSGLTASSLNEFFEVCLGGLITIPAAFMFLGATGAVGSTFGLGFNTLPIVFEYMPAGRVFGFLWFFMLFLAAITSSISMLQPAIAFLEEGLQLKRRASVTLLGLLTALGSLFVIYFSKGLLALDTMDFWVGTFFVFVLATMQVILFGWGLGIEKGMEAAHRGAEMRIPRIFSFIIKYVSPVYLLTVFVFWCGQNVPKYWETLGEGGVPLYAVCLIGVFFLFILLLINIASERWDTVSWDGESLEDGL